MNLLLEAAKRALAAIENGESFRHLDEVVAPMLRKGIDQPEPRLTDDQIGRLWFDARIPGLRETDARLLIRAAERRLKGEA